MNEKIRIKDNAGGIYASYLIKEIFSGPVEFNTAYEEQRKMHWLKDHAGKIGTITGKKDTYYSTFISVTVDGSECMVPLSCFDEITEDEK